MQNISQNIYRNIKITKKAGVNGYYITSEKYPNRRYGVKGDKLVIDAKNNRFIFEPTKPPQPNPRIQPGPRPQPIISEDFKRFRDQTYRNLSSLKEMIFKQKKEIANLKNQVSQIRKQMP